MPLYLSFLNAATLASPFRMRYVRLALLLAVVSCASARPTYVTPTGKPEIDIAGVGRSQVRDALVAQMTQAGYSVKAATEYSLSFEKQGGLMQNLLAGSPNNPQTVVRVTYTIVETGGAVKIIGAGAVVANSGTSSERLTDVTGGKPGNQIYDMLLHLKSSLSRSALAR